MSYQPENLSALSYANGFTLWHYRTSDTAAEVMEKGYFDAAARMLRLGDCILVNAAVLAGKAPANGQLWVRQNTGTFVEIDGSISILNLLNENHA